MSSKAKRPQIDITDWMGEHRDFVEWWKEHRDSGYAENRDGSKSRYSIVPWKAWKIEKYHAEYTGESERYSHEEIASMREEQRKVEAKTAELEMCIGKEFWKRMTPAEFIANVKMAAREAMEERGSMAEKMEKTYEYEPGQSEEETRLLERRRIET